ncbi:hypothetical protein AJ79_06108 [Helicocarpus griseus UAMH5409]|uniref:Uncharacterized protein n=1 Tax=Helicocarpus griseus UAMH5409 TaxID=1447875 RepID=A0A2B7XHK6_9EURO|nr:hypothetical protein AJ79_06108 [Helicocarpus griseus UAMH5409]
MKGSWNSLPPEIHYQIFAGLAHLQDFDEVPSGTKRLPLIKRNWRPIVSYLLVCGSWKSSLESTLIKKYAPATILVCANEPIALKALERAVHLSGLRTSRRNIRSHESNLNVKDCYTSERLPTQGDSRPGFGDLLGKLLMIATTRRFYTCLAFLLENGAGAEVIKLNYPIIVEYAIRSGSSKSVQLLLEHKEPLMDNNHPSLVAKAEDCGRADIANLLRRYGVKDTDCHCYGSKSLLIPLLNIFLGRESLVLMKEFLETHSP